MNQYGPPTGSPGGRGPLGAQDVRAVVFTTTRMRLGYDVEEVDAFLDHVQWSMDVLAQKLAQAQQAAAVAEANRDSLIFQARRALEDALARLGGPTGTAPAPPAGPTSGGLGSRSAPTGRPLAGLAPPVGVPLAITAPPAPPSDSTAQPAGMLPTAPNVAETNPFLGVEPVDYPNVDRQNQPQVQVEGEVISADESATVAAGQPEWQYTPYQRDATSVLPPLQPPPSQYRD